MDHIAVRLSDGVTLAVLPSLNSISSYVFLEQETWFERKEGAFVRRYLKPGMTALDIGANVGAYSLPMARLVGPDGRITAYEPASEPRRLLEISRQLNHADNLDIVAAALSDVERQGRLMIASFSEANALGNDGRGEDVWITTLDREEVARSLQSPDFVKIDAEGEEERVLSGGRVFFDRHSPLVMFEIKAGETINTALCSLFIDRGYACYRALAGGPILVPSNPGEPFDRFELNLFAAKPDRVMRLAADGLLVDHLPSWSPDANARNAAMEYLKHRPFAAPFSQLMDHAHTRDTDYIDGLAAYAEWHDRSNPVERRCAALQFAYKALQESCVRAPTLARLSSFARCAWDWGNRSECVAALHQLVEQSQRNAAPPSEPFWPAAARFDEIVATPQQMSSFFFSAVLEQFERAASFSSLYGGHEPFAEWLCAQPFASAEMERRRFLRRLRARQSSEAPPRMRHDAPDNLNAELWRDSRVIEVLRNS
jgi:FkbM family methyltransferase